MPLRPRQHQVEQISRDIFRAKLTPLNWIFEDFAVDYGVDGRVEIFRPDGSATGKMFLVQLKATDEGSLERALGLRLKTETIRYWESLSLPLLLVLLHTPTSRLFAKWFHEFDADYRPGTKTKVIRLDVCDQWTDETPKRIERDIDAFSRLRDPQLSLPLEFVLLFDGDNEQSMRQYSLESAIQRVVEQRPRLVQITSELPDHAHFSVVVRENGFTVNLAGLKRVSFKFSKGYWAGTVSATFPFDVLTGIAFTLNSFGHISIAAQLFCRYAWDSVLRKDFKVAFEMSLALAGAGQMTEALRFAEALLSEGGNLFLVEMALFAPSFGLGPMSEGHDEFLQQLMIRIIAREEAAGENTATCEYNLANFLNTRGLCKEAIRHYRRAVEADPTYLDRAYFWREFAGALFHSRRYRLAAEFYRRSLELGDGDRSLPLYADALLFCGRYSDAEQVFADCVTTGRHPEAEWQLKLKTLLTIREMAGSPRQARDSKGALSVVEACLESHNKGGTDSEVKICLEQALTIDGLCGPAWFNLGVAQACVGDAQRVRFAYLIAAVLEPYDVDAWTRAIVSLVSSEEHRALLPVVFAMAYRHNGEDLADRIYALASSQPASFNTAGFLKWVRSMLDSNRESDRPPKRSRRKNAHEIINIDPLE